MRENAEKFYVSTKVEFLFDNIWTDFGKWVPKISDVWSFGHIWEVGHVENI